MLKEALKKKETIGIIGLLLLTAVIAMYSPLNPIWGKGLTTDQAVFYTIAKGLLEGKLAYVDFFDHKGSFLYLLLAAGLALGKLLGGLLLGNFLLELLVIFVSASFMYKIARLFAGEWLSFLTVACIFLSDITLFTTSNSEEYMFPLLCISVYLFLLQIRQEGNVSNPQVFVIGLCGMLVFFIKYNYSLIWAAMGVLLLLCMGLWRRSFRQIVGMCISFGLGMLAVALPFGIYLLATNSFAAFMDTYVLYSLHYAEYTGLTERLNCMAFLLDTPLCRGLIIAVILWLVLLFGKKKNQIPMKEMGIFLVLAAVVVVTTASPGQSWYYYKQATMVIYTVPIAFLGQFLLSLAGNGESSPIDELKAEKSYKFILEILVSVGLAVVLLWGTNREDFHLKTDDRLESAQTISQIIRDNCGEGDTMISFSNDCTMYFYSDCPVASRIFFPSAAIVEEDLLDELMGDLEEKQPRILTFQNDWQAGLSGQMIQEVEDFTEENYSLIYQDKYRDVYQRRQ
jgi:hypothetical protein